MFSSLLIIQKLNWDLSPITSNNWLSTYIQLAHDLAQPDAMEGKEEDDHGFVFPRYSPLTFVQVRVAGGDDYWTSTVDSYEFKHCFLLQAFQINICILLHSLGF